MKIIGFKRGDFTSKDGVAVTGYNVYLAYPATGADAYGVICERIYFSDTKLVRSGYKLHVNDEVNISYNRYGKPESITVVK